MTGSATTDTIAVTVHGPTGALDLLVPVGAAVADVAREYAASCGLPQPPELLTPARPRCCPSPWAWRPSASSPVRC